MAQKTIHPHAGSVALQGNNEVAFLLIHGYTGSPTDFNGLPLFLHENYGVSVFSPLLPGHGTSVEDLRGLTKSDFMKVAEEALQPLLQDYKKVIIGGHSFGGQVALDIATRYPVSGVFVTAVPYKLYFPLCIPGFYEFWRMCSFKEFLKKRFTLKDEHVIVKSFSYDQMPAYGLKLMNEINNDLRKSLPKLQVPLLSIFFKGDKTTHPDSGNAIKELVGSKVKKIVLLDSGGHRVFFTAGAPSIYKEIAEFFQIH